LDFRISGNLLPLSNASITAVSSRLAQVLNLRNYNSIDVAGVTLAGGLRNRLRGTKRVPGNYIN